MNNYDLEATPLRGGRWAIRPAGQLGTCGFYPKPWTVYYADGPEAAALARAKTRVWGK